MTGYRAAEHVSCRRWLLAAGAAVAPEDLVFVAEFGQRAITSWVDSALDLIIGQIEQERDELMGGALARRLEVVTLIVDGAPSTSTWRGSGSAMTCRPGIWDW